MKALIREHENGTTEVMTEPFNDWVKANLTFLVEIDGWTLIENYEPVELVIE